MVDNQAEEDLYGVSDDEASPPVRSYSFPPRLASDPPTRLTANSSTRVVAEVNTTFPTCRFLNVPYEIRKLIYTEILCWVDIEFCLHVDSTHFCHAAGYPEWGLCGHPADDLARVCLIRRYKSDREYDSSLLSHQLGAPLPEIETLIDDYHLEQLSTDEDEDLEHGSLISPDENDMVFCHARPSLDIPHSYRYTTSLNLRATCRQIKRELTDLFWASTTLIVDLEYWGPAHIRSNKLVKSGLNHWFLSMPIGSNIRNLAIDFSLISREATILKSYSKAGAANDDPLFETKNALRTILSIPKLLRVELYINEMESSVSLERSGVLDHVLNILRRNEDLVSVTIQGNMCDSVVEKWRSILGAAVAVIVGDKDQKWMDGLCYTFLGDYHLSDDYWGCWG